MTINKVIIGLFVLILPFVFKNMIEHKVTPGWIYGAWITVARSQEVADNDINNLPIEKHILMFKRNGELYRYSKSKGWAKLLVKFKEKESSVLIKPQLPNSTYLPLIQIQKDGRIVANLQRNRFFLYEKAALSNFDKQLEGNLRVIEFKYNFNK